MYKVKGNAKLVWVSSRRAVIRAPILTASKLLFPDSLK
jgi:hypothetical protein